MIVAKECFRKYFFRIVLGFTDKDTPPYFTFGSVYHKFREILELKYMESPTKDDKELDNMILFAIQAALVLAKKLKMTDPMVGTKWEFMTKARLVESCMVAGKHWKREKLMGEIEVLAVEQNFNIEVKDENENPTGIFIGGKADQILRWRGRLWGRDFKTSSQNQEGWYIRSLDPNDQFTRYTWAEAQLNGEHVEGQLIEVMYNAKSTKTTKKGPKIYPHMATRTEWQLKRWIKEQIFFSKLLDQCREEDIYPMEEKSCVYCIFHSVCKKGSERAMIAKLQAEFKHEPWDCTNREVD